MHLTNHHNIPQPLCDVAQAGLDKPKDNLFRVTSLVGPPLARYLTMKHWDELEEDVSEKLYAILGSGVHSLLEQANSRNAIVEKRHNMLIDGVRITGQSDSYFNNIIEDWKVTSVYSFIYGVKPEWEKQLNCYATLWEKNGYVVNGLSVHAILRDWMKSKSYDSNYPDIPFISYKIKLWDQKKRIAYLEERLKAHKTSPVECTEEEKWARPTTYAIMKKARKSALRVLESAEKAEEYLEKFIKKEDQKKCSIVERKGVNVRCQEYCTVRKFCKYSGL